MMTRCLLNTFGEKIQFTAEARRRRGNTKIQMTTRCLLNTFGEKIQFTAETQRRRGIQKHK